MSLMLCKAIGWSNDHGEYLVPRKDIIMMRLHVHANFIYTYISICFRRQKLHSQGSDTLMSAFDLNLRMTFNETMMVLGRDAEISAGFRQRSSP
jgi:hypothetical protein